MHQVFSRLLCKQNDDLIFGLAHSGNQA